ncbi:3-oxoacyl-ACP reductase family protein [Streptomyces sp. NPDC041068]|uniref:3-oxoacyl-ACP reductase family protein n=1 Tax=Streptomyces sp. NPDC041068 TaxID=3155130 RepID=UPI0033E4192D
MPGDGGTTAEVALVTGGSRGIGAAVTAALAGRGHRVAIAYSRDRAAAAEAAAETGCLAVRADVTDPAQVDALFHEVGEHFGSDVQILVNCAGLLSDALVGEMTTAQWQTALDVNLTGPFLCSSRAAAGMAAARWGRIVTVGSAAGVLGSAGQTNYAAAKAGLVGLTRSLARELAPHTTCNVVAPGPVDTAMINHLTDKRRRQLADMIPFKRFGTVTEVASAIAFLCSREAGFITGALLPVDGGMSMGH